MDKNQIQIMMRIFLAITFLLCMNLLHAQYINRDGTTLWLGRMGVGKTSVQQPDANAWLEIGDQGTTRSMIIPRVSATGNVLSPKEGMFHYDVTDKKLHYYNTAWHSLLDETTTTDQITEGTKKYWSQALFDAAFATIQPTLAPASGSANYIQNQGSSAQAGNFWISGNGEIDGELRLFSASPIIKLAGGDPNYAISRSGTTILLTSQGSIDFRVPANNTGQRMAITGSYIRFYIGGNSHSIINSSGQWGIGATTFIGTEKLRVNGDQYIDGNLNLSSASKLYWNTNTYISQSSGDLNINTLNRITSTASDFRWNNGANFAMTLNSSGALLIGQTAQAGTEKLRVSGAAQTDYLYAGTIPVNLQNNARIVSTGSIQAADASSRTVYMTVGGTSPELDTYDYTNNVRLPLYMNVKSLTVGGSNVIYSNEILHVVGGAVIEDIKAPAGQVYMTTVDANGRLGSQAIPSGGSGGTVSLPSNQIAYGNGTGLASNNNFLYSNSALLVGATAQAASEKFRVVGDGRIEGQGVVYRQTTYDATSTYTAGGFYGAMYVNQTDNFATDQSIPNSAIKSGQINLSFLQSSASSTINLSQTESSARAMSNNAVATVLMPNAAGVNTTISHAAGLQIYSLQQNAGSNWVKFTNYYALLIGAVRENLSYDNSVVQNWWGLYQAGSEDKNYFAGQVSLGTTSFVGSERLRIYNGDVVIDNIKAPAATTYMVTVDASGKLGSQAIGTGGGTSATFVDKETPIGAMNGVNRSFTLTNSPVAGSEYVYYNGILLDNGSDYTISGANITLTFTPDINGKIRVSYRK